MTGVPPGRRSIGGFTLVELPVAMTLLGLIFVALFGGLRFGTRTWEVGNERSEAFAEVEVVQSLLRRQLAQAVMLRVPKGHEPVFLGEEDRLGFAAPGPKRCERRYISRACEGSSMYDRGGGVAERL